MGPNWTPDRPTVRIYKEDFPSSTINVGLTQAHPNYTPIYIVYSRWENYSSIHDTFVYLCRS